MNETTSRPSTPQSAHDFSKLLDCDVVFRGGITSGVVYPGAVAALAERYRFRSIGGASAGAIAAGVAAAAEYGRQAGRADAFAEVEALAAEVGGGTGGLRRLFRADRRLRSLEWVVWALLRLGMSVVLLGLLAAGLVVAVAATVRFGTVWAGVACFLALPILFSGWLAWTLLVALPKAGFGLSPGVNPEAAQDRNGLHLKGALMDWMHATIQRLAGRQVCEVPSSAAGPEAVPLENRPLTMGDLWGGEAERAIELLLTTTNLSQQLPHQFPFLERNPGAIYFHPDDLKKVLPRDVVRWMVIAAPREDDAETAETARSRGLLRLPLPEHLPVLFGIRLSLSFPGLIAAVRLFAQGEDARGRSSTLRPCWFSDGGITSNFPIYAFDSPLPSRPTFCIDLRDAPAAQQDAAVPPPPNTAPTSLGQSADPLIVMARDNRPSAPLFRAEISGSLPAFLASIVSTARSAQENELMLMPGYRDRIAHVLTRPEEGGLNLNMPADIITGLSRRGRRAAELLVSRFHPEGAAAQAGFRLGWANQRWVRYRSTMAALERFLADFRRSWEYEPQGTRAYDEVRRHWELSDPENLRSLLPGRRATPSYRWRNEETAKAAGRGTEAVLALAETLHSEAVALPSAASALSVSLFDGVQNVTGEGDGTAPRPKLGLRNRPVVNDPMATRTYEPGATLTVDLAGQSAGNSAG
jgi:predicted acylesterase/phospholipase RssA